MLDFLVDQFAGDSVDEALFRLQSEADQAMSDGSFFVSQPTDDRLKPTNDFIVTGTSTVSFFGEMPAHEYHQRHDAVSKSMIGTFKQDGRRVYQSKFITHDMPSDSHTKSTKIGDMVHAVLLEPSRIADFSIIPNELLAVNGAASTKEAKAYKKEAEANGKVVCKADEWALMSGMVKSFKKAFGQWLDLDSKKENAIFWTCPETGLLLKCRPDWLIVRDGWAAVFDIKTCLSAHPLAFRKACEDYDYGIQQAHYLEGVKAALGIDNVEFFFLAVENEFPYRCAPYRIRHDSVLESNKLRRKLLNEIKQCNETGDWSETWEPKQGQAIQELPLRRWSFEMGFDDATKG